METVLIRKAVLNTVAASGANVKNDVAAGPYPGSCIVCSDNTLDTLINYLPPIFKGTCVKAYKQASEAEVRQILVIGRSDEVIVAGTRYKIQIGNGDTYEGQGQTMYQYAYTAPLVLSGNAETDRLAVYTQLNAKINSHSDNKAASYLVYKVAFTGGTTALPQVGETVTQSTSGITAKIAAVTVATGNFTATTAAGYIWLYDFSALASWDSSSETLTGATSGAVVTTAAALTTGAGLVLVDDAGYYGSRPNTKRGPSYVSLTDGWSTAELEDRSATLAVGTTGDLVGRAPVYSNGIGSRLSLDSPVFAADKLTLVRGEAYLETTAPFDATKTYTTFIMEVNVNPSDTNITGYGKIAPVYYVLYADESNSTNLTNLESALETALGVTIA